MRADTTTQNANTNCNKYSSFLFPSSLESKESLDSDSGETRSPVSFEDYVSDSGSFEDDEQDFHEPINNTFARGQAYFAECGNFSLRLDELVHLVL